MTKLPFLINGVDFAHLVHKRGYTTIRKPVIAASFTDLGGVDTEVITRWKSTLVVNMNHLTEAQVRSISTELMKPVVRVTFYNAQNGETVTKEMKAITLQHENDFVSGVRRWWDGGTLKFVEK